MNAIPRSAMGDLFLNSVTAAERIHNDQSAIGPIYATFFGSDRPHYVTPATQIARSVFCEAQGPSLARQLKELRAARQLELRFSAEQILTIHVNRAYFGRGTYGAFGAARRYFDKAPTELSLDEAAYLAGITRSPDLYLRHPDRALKRRRDVLDEMAARRFITQAEADAVKQVPLHAKLD